MPTLMGDGFSAALVVVVAVVPNENPPAAGAFVPGVAVVVVPNNGLAGVSAGFVVDPNKLGVLVNAPDAGVAEACVFCAVVVVTAGVVVPNVASPGFAAAVVLEGVAVPNEAIPGVAVAVVPNDKGVVPDVAAAGFAPNAGNPLEAVAL